MATHTESFYITLPSDAQRHLHPNNTNASFSTRLPKGVRLVGKWECALVEVQYKSDIKNYNQLSDKSLGIHIKPSAKAIKQYKLFPDADGMCKFTILIPSGFYSSPKKMIDSINDKIRNHPDFQGLERFVGFSYDQHSKKAEFQVWGSTSGVSFEDANLAKALQFDVDNYGTGVYTSKSPITFHSRYETMYIYASIADYSYVGDTLAQLLRSMPIAGRTGKSQVETFNRPFYVPLQLTVFDTIDVKLLNHLGEDIPFSENRTEITLHLRPRVRYLA